MAQHVRVRLDDRVTEAAHAAPLALQRVVDQAETEAHVEHRGWAVVHAHAKCGGVVPHQPVLPAHHDGTAVRVHEPSVREDQRLGQVAAVVGRFDLAALPPLGMTGRRSLGALPPSGHVYEPLELAQVVLGECDVGGGQVRFGRALLRLVVRHPSA